MKRFYQTATVGPDRGILLDDRPVKTPARAALRLPNDALAEAVAAEWRAQGAEIDPRSMPLTGLANAAIDRVAPDPARFLATLGDYAETDVLCYRTAAPADLADRQRAAWDPLLAWASTRYDMAFTTATGIVHLPQPHETVARLRTALAAHGPFRLAALSPLVTISGSLVTALAIAEQEIDAPAAFAATHLDELWQAEKWGEEWSAADARAARLADFAAAARFLALA